MTLDPYRVALIREQFAPPVREYRPGLEPIDDVTAARNRRVLVEAMNDSNEHTEGVA